MREDRPSVTAALVSLARGIGVADDQEDPWAESMLPPPVGALLGAYRRSGRVRLPLRGMLRGLSLGAVDHIVLRMAAIDQAMREAEAAGAEQLVILGAGLDARAYRSSRLEPERIFEVDHPATQAYKRERVRALDSERRPVFVPVDFEKQRISQELAAAGHDPASATFWIWEGVTMYLGRSVIAACLGEIALASAPGSRVAVTYAVPAIVPSWMPQSARLRAAIDASFRLLSEPLRGLLPPDEMQGLLVGAGFSPLSDTGSADWAWRAGAGQALVDPLEAERLAVAERRER